VAQVAAIADAQAKLHVALQDFPLEREYRRDHQYWTGVAEQLKPNMTQDDQTL
ncbi:homoserine kinase, partial [Acinetobacter baumannii]|nr:homoserine kinase [Acinetobacter baumannii]